MPTASVPSPLPLPATTIPISLFAHTTAALAHSPRFQARMKQIERAVQRWDGIACALRYNPEVQAKIQAAIAAGSRLRNIGQGVAFALREMTVAKGGTQ